MEYNKKLNDYPKDYNNYDVRGIRYQVLFYNPIYDVLVSSRTENKKSTFYFTGNLDKFENTFESLTKKAATFYCTDTFGNSMCINSEFLKNTIIIYRKV